MYYESFLQTVRTHSKDVFAGIRQCWDTHMYCAYAIGGACVIFASIFFGTWIVLSQDAPLPPIEKISEVFILGSNPHASSVTISGTIEPLIDTTLSAEASGVITSFPYHAGDAIPSGALIMSIEQKNEYAQVLLADARIAEARAQLQKIQNGTREEQLAVLAQTSAHAKDGVRTAEAEAYLALIAAYTAIDNAFPGGVDGLFNDASSVNPALIFTTTQNSAKIIAQNNRVAIGDILKRHAQKNTSADITQEIHTTENELEKAKETLDSILRALDGAVATGEFSQARVDTEVSVATTRRAHLLEASASLVNAKMNRANAESAYTIAATQQSEGVRGARPEDIAAAEALLKSAEALRASAYAQLAHTETRAPFAGIISETYVTLGERVSPGTPVARLASNGGWKIIFSVPDTYNESLAVGQTTLITVRGIDGSFSGSIARIIPALESHTRRIRFEVLLDTLPAVARTGMVAEATLTFGTPLSSEPDTLRGEYEVPNHFVGYDYDGAFVISENARLPVFIRTRGYDLSRIEGTTLHTGMILTHPLQRNETL